MIEDKNNPLSFTSKIGVYVSYGDKKGKLFSTIEVNVFLCVGILGNIFFKVKDMDEEEE